MQLVDDSAYRGKRVCVALSGGRDSVALLHALAAAGADVRALHCDHGIRAAAGRDRAFVQELCRAWGVPLRVFEADIPARARREKRGLEETARIWRYECFQCVLREGWADVVATAHHKNDAAETVLFRLARGTGLAGLNVFPPREGVVRPMKDVPRSAVDAYVARHGLPYAEDESNADLTFARNRIRHTVLPALEAAVPGAADNLAAFAARAAEDDALLASLAERELSFAAGGWRVPVLLPAPLFVRAVRAAMARLGVTRDYTAANFAEAARLKELRSGARASLPAGLYAVREGAYVTLARPLPPPAPVAFACGTFAWGEGTLVVSGTPAEGALRADMDAFPAGCEVRTRREGDVFTPFGGKKKTLKKFLTDRKIPARIGRMLPVVAKGNEVYAVVGAEIADGVKVTKNTVRKVWLSCTLSARENKGEQDASRL